MQKERNFVVPHDFSEAADNALMQAIEIAKPSSSKVHVLHVITKENEVHEARSRLNEVLSSSSYRNLEKHIKNGSIFNIIGEFAEEKSATAIIMGTHGAKGMQKIFGSFAMKVIISTSIPFMVVQKDSEIKKVNRICINIESSAESMQITRLASYLAKTYHAKIHIIAEKSFDKSKAVKIKNNMVLLSKHLNKIEVDYKLELLDNNNDWGQTVLKYGRENSMDMYAYSYDSDRFLASNDKFSQSLLFNEDHIPCLIINAKQVTSTYF